MNNVDKGMEYLEVIRLVAKDGYTTSLIVSTSVNGDFQECFTAPSMVNCECIYKTYGKATQIHNKLEIISQFLCSDIEHSCMRRMVKMPYSIAYEQLILIYLCSRTTGLESIPDHGKLNWTSVYVMIFKSKDEQFIKVGMSGDPENRRNRLVAAAKHKYEVELVYHVDFTSKKTAYKAEQSILRMISCNNYRPKHKFVGHTECLAFNKETKFMLGSIFGRLNQKITATDIYIHLTFSEGVTLPTYIIGDAKTRVYNQRYCQKIKKVEMTRTLGRYIHDFIDIVDCPNKCLKEGIKVPYNKFMKKSLLVDMLMDKI